MADLVNGTCIPCRGDTLRLTAEEINELHPQVVDWKLVEVTGVPRLERIFKMKDFSQAINFTNLVAEIAEEQDHHPLIVTEWGQVKVQWWTHILKGLHQNDFIMAAKTDKLAISLTIAP